MMMSSRLSVEKSYGVYLHLPPCAAFFIYFLSCLSSLRFYVAAFLGGDLVFRCDVHIIFLIRLLLL